VVNTRDINSDSDSADSDTMIAAVKKMSTTLPELIYKQNKNLIHA
jgi:hypothetical protein